MEILKDMRTGDISVSSGTPLSTITISADSIRMETSLASLARSVPSECCYSVKTNCVNCGAPLSGESVCRYCDTYNGVI